MRTQALMSRLEDPGTFRPLTFAPSRGPAGNAPKLSRGGRHHLGDSAATQVIQKNLMQPSPVPNWGIYAGSALLVTGGIMGLMAEEKSVFSVALGATMIGVGGFLFFQTLKQG